MYFATLDDNGTVDATSIKSLLERTDVVTEYGGQNYKNIVLKRRWSAKRAFGTLAGSGGTRAAFDASPSQLSYCVFGARNVNPTSTNYLTTGATDGISIVVSVKYYCVFTDRKDVASS